ncbi:MAG TPA: hypothetical protein ENO16_03555 [Chromatiales bacterium]|nr:hypothetical protein [Chromatiales bacterium]
MRWSRSAVMAAMESSSPAMLRSICAMRRERSMPLAAARTEAFTACGSAISLAEGWITFGFTSTAWSPQGCWLNTVWPSTTHL